MEEEERAAGPARRAGGRTGMGGGSASGEVAAATARARHCSLPAAMKRGTFKKVFGS